MRAAEVAAAQDESRLKLDALAAQVKPLDRYARLLAARAKLDKASSVATVVDVLATNTAGVANSVSEPLSQILKLLNRAETAAAYVDSVAQLRNALSTMYTAFGRRDYEEAAEAAAAARALPPALIAGKFALRMVPSSELPDNPEVTLKNCCAEMAAVFSREFDAASRARKMEVATRFFKYFPLIGHRAQGLQRYSRFLRELIAEQGRGLLATMPTSPNIYVLALSRFFENIALILEKHAALVTKYYGDGAMVEVVASIQAEVDAQAGMIVDSWWDERRVESVIADSRSYNYPGLVEALGGHISGAGRRTPATPDASIDISPAADCLSELVPVLNRWNLYCSFATSRWPSAADSLEQSQFANKTRKILIPAFAALSVFVLRLSIERAAQSDEQPEMDAVHTEDTPLVSSMVEDGMFVVRTLLDQAASGNAAEALEAILPSFRRVIESDYLGILKYKLSSIDLRRRQEIPRSFVVLLNNLVFTAQFLENVLVRDNIPDQFHALSEAMNLEATRTKLEDFATGISCKARQIALDGVEKLYNAQIAPSIKYSCVSSFKGNYMLTLEHPESSRAATFESSWIQVFKPLRPVLHPDLIFNIESSAAGLVAQLLEKWIWQLEGQINELGAIALNRDVSKIISMVSKNNYHLRDELVRVAQIVSIACGDEDIDTVLTSTECDKARKLVA